MSARRRFRYAGKAPLFQEVVASEPRFERYVVDLSRSAIAGVDFRFIDVAAQPECSRRSTAS